MRCKMAKASKEDFDAAIDVTNILQALERGRPITDIEGYEDCENFEAALLKAIRQGSLMRVVWGMQVLCNPKNELIDQDSDVLEVHPSIAALRDAAAAASPNLKETDGTQPTEPDPQVLRVRAPAPGPAGDQQADRRPGQADGGDPAAERGDERRPAEAAGGKGLLRPGKAALSAAALVAIEQTGLLKAKDVAYSERDRCVQALSVAFPSYLTRHPDSDLLWETEWRWIVVVDLPTGQASWHIHDSERSWFNHLQVRGNQWDGHTTKEKHARIAKLAEGSGGIPLYNPAARAVHKRLQEREFAVHKRLDELGVPTDPVRKTARESVAALESADRCRAVERLEWLAGDRDRWREQATRASQEVLMSAPPVVSAFEDHMGKQCVVLRNGEVWCWEMGQGGVEGWHHRTPALPKRLQSPMEA